MFGTLLQLQFQLMQSLLALRRYANWRLVRSLAELQILTRASYVMLVLVPLLAALWPAVRMVVNQHNRAVSEATAIFDKASDRLSGIESRIASQSAASATRPPALSATDEIQAAVSELKTLVARYNEHYIPKTIDTPIMPSAFAAAFFAALAVVLAHTLYQIFAPEIIRRMTLDQYVADRKEDYSKHPTLTAVREAELVLQGDIRSYDFKDDYSILKPIIASKNMNAVKPEFSDAISKMSLPDQEALRELVDNPEKIRRYTHLLTDGDVQAVNQVLTAVERDRSSNRREAVERQRVIGTVGRGAHVSYLRMAETSAPAMVATSIVYAFALYIIATILVDQTSHVMDSSGIKSFPNVLEWWKLNKPR